jgi:hypothetical protein
LQVRSGVAAPSLIVTQKVPRSGGIPVPALSTTTVAMVKGITTGSYTTYSGSLTINSATGAKYDVTSGNSSDSFNDVSLLGVSCVPPPTLAHKAVVGAYTFQGCYTEGSGVRALSAATYYNYTAMTSEMCASNCAGYTYWGIEYHGEC